MKWVTLQRIERVLVGMYFLVLLGAIGFFLTAAGDSVIGSAMLGIYLSRVVLGAAVITGMLILLANALTTVWIDEPDWVSIVLAAATAGSILTAFYINTNRIGPDPGLVFLILSYWGALVGPSALAVHVGRIPSLDTLHP